VRQKDGGPAFVPLRGTTVGKQKKSTVAFSYGGQGGVGSARGTANLANVANWGGRVPGGLRSEIGCPQECKKVGDRIDCLTSRAGLRGSKEL